MLAIKLRRLPFSRPFKTPITENSPLTRGNCSLPNSRARNDAVIRRGKGIYSAPVHVRPNSIEFDRINRTAGGNLTASWQFENAKEGIETGLKDGGKARGLIFDRTRKRKREKLIFSRDETCYLIYIYLIAQRCSKLKIIQ